MSSRVKSIVCHELTGFGIDNYLKNYFFKKHPNAHVRVTFYNDLMGGSKMEAA